MISIITFPAKTPQTRQSTKCFFRMRKAHPACWHYKQMMIHAWYFTLPPMTISPSSSLLEMYPMKSHCTILFIIFTNRFVIQWPTIHTTLACERFLQWSPAWIHLPGTQNQYIYAMQCGAYCCTVVIHGYGHLQSRLYFYHAQSAFRFHERRMARKSMCNLHVDQSRCTLSPPKKWANATCQSINVIIIPTTHLYRV